jgi:hypothetical protein
MRNQGKKESSHDLSADVIFWSYLGIVIILIILSLSRIKYNSP